MNWVWMYIAMVNVASFLMYGIDKWNAKRNLRRIPEKILLEIAALGGSVGAYIGMKLFCHKTRKPKFYIGIPIILVIQIGLLVYIYYKIRIKI